MGERLQKINAKTGDCYCKHVEHTRSRAPDLCSELVCIHCGRVMIQLHRNQPWNMPGLALHPLAGTERGRGVRIYTIEQQKLF